MPNKTKKGPKKSKKPKVAKKPKEEKQKEEIFDEVDETPVFADEIDELNYELGKAQERITPGGLFSTATFRKNKANLFVHWISL